MFASPRTEVFSQLLEFGFLQLTNYTESAMKRTLLVTCLVLVVGVALACAILRLIGDTLYTSKLEDFSEEELLVALDDATTAGDIVGWSDAKVEALIKDFEGVQNSATMLPAKKVMLARKAIDFARGYREYAEEAPPRSPWVRELNLFIVGLEAFIAEFREAIDYTATKTSVAMAYLWQQALDAYSLPLTDPDRVSSAFSIRKELARIRNLIGIAEENYTEQITATTDWVNKIITDDESWGWIQEKIDKDMKKLDEIENTFGTNRLDKWSVNPIIERWQNLPVTLTQPQFDTFDPQIDRLLQRAYALRDRFGAWIESIDNPMGGALPMVITASVGSNYITCTDHCVARMRLP